MFGGIRWGLFALLLSCRQYQVAAQSSNCEEFGRGINFDPHLALGNWTTVLYRPAMPGHNMMEISITELTPAQLVQYEQVVKEYSASILKLKIESSTASSKRNPGTIFVPTDTLGNLDALYLVSGTTDQNQTPSWVRRVLKWKTVQGFLLFMSCESKVMVIASRTSVPDEAKLQQVVEGLPHN